MAKFTPHLHPRDKNGRFKSKGGRVSLVKSHVSNARTAYAAYSDIASIPRNVGKAAAWGVTGHYVNASLYGTKAATATSRVGSSATRQYVARSTFAPGKKQRINARLNKIDDRTQTVENVATIGLALTGASIRRPAKAYPTTHKGTAGTFIARKRLPAVGRGKNVGRPNKQGVYSVTKVRRVASAGARVKR